MRGAGARIGKENARPVSSDSNRDVAKKPLTPKAKPASRLASRDAAPASKAAAKSRGGPPGRTQVSTRAPQKTQKQKLEEDVALLKQKEIDLLATEEAEEAELQRLIQEAEEAERETSEAYQDLMDTSAFLATQYSTREAEINALEAEQKDVEQNLEEQHKRNSALSKRNLELDQQNKITREKLAADEAELARLSRSQEELDAEVDKQKQNCERVRLLAGEHADRLKGDLENIARMQARLEEVCEGFPSEEAVKLFDLSDEDARKTKQALAHAEEVHRLGPLLQPSSGEVCED